MTDREQTRRDAPRVPPMPDGFTDRAAWDAIHLRFSRNGTSVLDQAVIDWQRDNQERVQAAFAWLADPDGIELGTASSWIDDDPDPVKGSWICAWCGQTNDHDGVICERCHHYGQPLTIPPERRRRCAWGYGNRKRRCANEAVRVVDTATTRAYYCEGHAMEAERLAAGADR